MQVRCLPAGTTVVTNKAYSVTTLSVPAVWHWLHVHPARPALGAQVTSEKQQVRSEQPSLQISVRATCCDAKIIMKIDQLLSTTATNRYPRLHIHCTTLQFGGCIVRTERLPMAA